MATMEMTYAHITKKEGQPAFIERIPRFRVFNLINPHLAYGWSAEELCRQYPILRRSEVYSAMAYYYDHLDEIDVEIQADLQAFDRSRESTPLSPAIQRLLAEGRLKPHGGS